MKRTLLITLLIFLMASSVGYAGGDIQPLGIEQIDGSMDIGGLTGNITLNAATGNEVAYTLNYTTNKATSGNDTGLLINQTDTASPGTSLLADFQVNGSSKANIDNAGSAYFIKNIALNTTDMEEWPGFNVVQIGSYDTVIGGASNGFIRNAYYAADGYWKYRSTATAGKIAVVTGIIYLQVAPSGTIDTNITWIQGLQVSNAGNVSIGTAAPNANAQLDVNSTTKAFMPPRMTTTQRDAIATPTEGMVIYNLTTHVLDFYNGTVWGPI